MATVAPKQPIHELPQIAREIAVADYPALKELCLNYYLPTIPADEAFSRYEDGWKRVNPEALTPQEKELIHVLTQVYGNGYFLG